MSIEWNEDTNNNNNKKDVSPLGTVDICDICRKPLEECPEWKQIVKSMKEIEEGKFKRYTIEEYIKELENDN